MTIFELDRGDEFSLSNPEKVFTIINFTLEKRPKFGKVRVCITKLKDGTIQKFLHDHECTIVKREP